MIWPHEMYGELTKLSSDFQKFHKLLIERHIWLSDEFYFAFVGEMNERIEIKKTGLKYGLLVFRLGYTEDKKLRYKQPITVDYGNIINARIYSPMEAFWRRYIQVFGGENMQSLGDVIRTAANGDIEGAAKMYQDITNLSYEEALKAIRSLKENMDEPRKKTNRKQFNRSAN